jgi:hypothetical protein
MRRMNREGWERRRKRKRKRRRELRGLIDNPKTSHFYSQSGSAV